MNNNIDNQSNRRSGCLPSLLGFIFGFYALGPIGAIIGAAIGSFMGGGYTRKDTEFLGDTPRQKDFSSSLLVLSAAVMKADGEVRRSELDYVKRFLLQNYGEQRGKEMLQILKQMVEKDIPIDQVCYQIKVNTDYNTRYHMVDFLFAIGGADGEFQQAELNMLRLIAQYLGISQGDYTSIYERHVGTGSSYSSNQTFRHSGNLITSTRGPPSPGRCRRPRRRHKCWGRNRHHSRAPWPFCSSS